MTIEISEKDTKADIKNYVAALPRPKGISAKKYAGKIKWGEDSLEFQKRLRDEW
jgi:hypothetical protein